MKNLLLGMGLILSAYYASAQYTANGLTASNGDYIGFYQFLPPGYAANPTAKYPLIIFMHGIGERGNGTTQLSMVNANGLAANLAAGNKMTFFWNGKWQSFIVMCPQLSTAYSYWQAFQVDEMIKYAKNNYRIDTNRIILTGLSLGGGGVWYYCLWAPQNAANLAAIGVSCGTCQGAGWCNIASANLPTWAFHANDDATVTVGCTKGAISNIQACNPAVQPYMTIWPSGGHSIWGRVYDTGYTWQNPNIYEWFLGQDKSLPVNKRPVAKAGADITVSSSPGTLNLSGAMSTDADGTLQRFIWSKLSGPAGGSIATPVSTSGLTAITGLTPGVYQYQLEVVDDRADWTYDTINVTVTAAGVPDIPPVTIAGPSQTTYTSAANLNGAGSYDPDGSITAYKWTEVSGPAVYTINSTTTASPALTGLLLGTYQFQLETTDNMGVKTRDTTTVTSTLSIVLPVNWLYFKGKVMGNTTQLVWATSSEVNNDHFEVEKSADGKTFSRIGSVKGTGMSATIKEYSYTDGLPDGTVYYRLKQVSTDGRTGYSEIITVSATINNTFIDYSPNPAHSSVKIMVKEKQTGITHIALYSIDGSLVMEKQLMKQDELLTTDLDVHRLVNGVYLLKVTIGDNLHEVTKIIKQ